MANIIVKSDERRAHEARVLESFGKNGARVSAADRDAAACVAARSREAYENLKRMEERRK